MAFQKRKHARQWDTEAERAARHFDTVQALRTENNEGSRKRLKQMRDVWYDTDPKATAGEFWNPDGKRLAKGSSGKHKRILAGQSARNNQARGL